MIVNADEQIHEVLSPNERLLWSGRCRRHAQDVQAVWRRSWGFVLVFSSVLLMFFVTRTLLDAGRPTAAMLSPIAVAIAGAAVLVVLRFLESWYWAKIAYGITDERALIVGGPFNRTMVSMPLAEMTKVVVRVQPDASGTLVFRDFWHQSGEDEDDLCPYEFREIADVQQVHALIIEACNTWRTAQSVGRQP